MLEEGVDILLIEDNPDDVELTLHAFKRHKIANTILTLRDGAEALDYLFSTGSHAGRTVDGRPKLILLDLKLPKVDGLEVLRRLKSSPATRSIPVVVLTSSAEEVDVAKSYDLGVNAYVVKPVDFENFAEAMSRLGLFWLVVNRPPGGPA